jgi:flagellar hook-length control protein FliK
MEDNSLKELTVKIKPKELGEITIKLITQGEIMKASINASNKETYDLLSSKIPEIKHALNTQNIKIEDVSIDFNDSFQSFQSGEGNFSREERNSSQNTTKYAAKDSLEATDAEDDLETLNNLNILA